MSSLPKREKVYEITATLLNQWQRIFDAAKYVKESESDTVAFETKVAEAQAKAKEEFVNTLRRVPVPENEAIIKGREYEKKVCDGLDEEFSPIIENGEFQAAYRKKIVVSGVNVMLYGILDVLKAGRIYDIKRVGRYQYPKYKTSHQHPMYFALVPNAIDFTYLVCDDNGEHHYENYLQCNCEDITVTIATFLSWLKANDLWDEFGAYWDWDERKKS